jgi:phage protein D
MRVKNNVPKFVEQKVAERRRQAKTGQKHIEKSDTKKYTAFDAAKKKFELKRKEAAAKVDSKLQHEDQMVQKQKERKQMGKLFNKRNAKGQPHMNSQLEVLMRRFNQQN